MMGDGKKETAIQSLVTITFARPSLTPCDSSPLAKKMKIMPPTDNLWKFLFIAGIVSVLTSFILDDKQSEKFQTALSEHRWRENEIELERAPKMRERDILLEKKKEWKEEDRAKFGKLQTELEALANDPESKKYLEMMSIAASERNELTLRFISLLVGGLLFTAYGGFMWYFKTQKLNDKKLRMEVEILTKSITQPEIDES